MRQENTSKILGLHWSIWAVCIVLVCYLIASAGTARAQHSREHAQFHSYYQSWANNDKQGCCNDRDCRELSDAHERYNRGELEVFVIGVGKAFGQSAWCKVEARHYLSRGNAPNWGKAHICISAFYGAETPCTQFICYQPRPQI